MNLVIVESPGKAKTIEKYLGKDFKVLASFGHVRDLPQKELGIDIDKNFEPTYVSVDRAKKVLNDIKKYEKNAETVYLATDLDREGEAISWHLLEALKLKADHKKVKRIVFSEITKHAIEAAVKNPRGLDMNLVDAQQGRRVLDRLVGYKLSPLLWKKVKSGLSAGRVQSVAVRLIVDREDEIKAFKSEEFWVLGVKLSQQKDDFVFDALLHSIDGKPVRKFDIKSEAEATKILDGLSKASYKVVSITQKEQIRRPSAPFTTSTLQMEASRKNGYSAKQTMRLAQSLYEAGHISYMRTDSTNLSSEAVSAIREEITSEFGKKYLPDGTNIYQTKAKRAQEAHEAIRPTHIKNRVVSDDPREQRLYELIWKRTVASQMKSAIFSLIRAEIEADNGKKYLFVASGEVMVFDGFIRVYTEGKDDEEEEGFGDLPALKEGESLDYKDLIKNQKFTEPPSRYTEATLVKKMESLGIGRPSTYAPTIATIQDRGYAELQEKRFFPTEIGDIVTKLLVAHFKDIVDYQFTAHMEDELDDVAAGEMKWTDAIKEFYEPFIANLKVKTKELDKAEFIKPEELDEKCPECGKNLLIRLGRYGKFISCSNYPECKYSRPLSDTNGKKGEEIEPELDEKCEKCGGKMLLKEGRFGKFYACENYPKCKNTKAIIKTVGMKCPECGQGDVVEKRTKRGKLFWGCSRYPGCKYASWTNPANVNAESSESDQSTESDQEETEEKPEDTE